MSSQMSPYIPVCVRGADEVFSRRHMAWMELRLAAAYFFKMCKGAELGPTANEDMQLENYFVITPKGKKCEISLRPSVENV